MDSRDYDRECKHCGAKPIVPGPHHSNTCKRHRTSLDLGSEEANRYTCKHCGIKPFVAGPHHKKNCPRYERTPYYKYICDKCGHIMCEGDNRMWLDFERKELSGCQKCGSIYSNFLVSDDAPRKKRKCISCNDEFECLEDQFYINCPKCTAKAMFESTKNASPLFEYDLEAGKEAAKAQYRKNVRDVARSHGIDPDSIM